MKRFVTSELSLDNNNYALPAGNLSWDATNGLRLHDGATAGGNTVGGNASGNSLINGPYTVALNSTTGVLSLSTASTIQGGGTGTNVTIIATNGTSTTSTWVFGETGGITFPDSTVQTTAYTGASSSQISNGSHTLSIDSYGQMILPISQYSDTIINGGTNLPVILQTFPSSGGPNSFTFGPNGNLTIPGVIQTNPGALYLNSNSYLQINTGNLFKQWNFDATGNLIFPDSTAQSTAWTGTVYTSEIADLYTVLDNFATLSYVTGLGYTTTASVKTLIANSLSNYTTSTLVAGTFTAVLSSTGTLSLNTLTATGAITASKIFVGPWAVSTSTGGGFATTSSLTAGSYTASLSSSTGVLTATAFSGDGSRLTNLNYTATSSIVGTLTNVQLVAGTSTWTFSSSATIVFPDGTIQSTAWTGSGGSSTTSTLTAGTFTAVLSTSTGVLTAPAFSGNGSLLTNLTYTTTNNVIGTNTNVQLIAGSSNYTWTFDQYGNLTLPNVPNPQITTSYTNGNLVLNPNGTGDVLITTSTQLYVYDTTTSVSTVTGAVVVSGGVGISGNLNAGFNGNTTTQHTLQSGIQLAPNATAITANAAIALGGAGGNYLAIGQYPNGATYNGTPVSYAQWIQSGYGGNNTPYALVLNPTGGSVIVPGGGTISKVSTATLALSTSLTLDNLAVQIKTQSSGVWIALGTVSGSTTYYYSITYQTGTGVASTATGTTNSLSATTTPALIGLSSWFFSAASQTAMVIVTDTTAGKMYRITWMTTSGTTPYGNYVAIERL
jgi:hypothetical protein